MATITNGIKVSHDLFGKKDNASALKSQTRYLQIALSLAFVLVVTISWGMTLSQLSENRRFIVQGLSRQQANLTAIIAENLYQVIDQNQAIGLVAQGWMRNHNQNQPSEIKHFIYSEQAFNRIALYDLDGQQIYQTLPDFQNVVTATDIKKYGAHFADNANVSARILVSGKGGGTDWQLPIIFPLKSGNQLQGVMLLEMNLGYLLNFLQGLDIGHSGKIAIFSEQGDILARYENYGLAKTDLYAAKPDYRNVPDSDHPVQFTYSHETSKYQVAVRKVRNYPVVISLSQRMDETLQEYNSYRYRILLGMVILSVFGSAGFVLLLRFLNQTDQYLASLKISAEEKKILLAKLEDEHKNAVDAASFDALTGLYNRRLFVSLAKQNLYAAKRNNGSYGLLFIDLDRFKTINDTLGHRIGDLLLQEVADRLLKTVRKSDIVARFGGDEFVILLTEMPSLTDISLVAEKIIATISKTCFLDGEELTVSPSIGIAIFPRDGLELEELIRNADAAMYVSKKSGRGRYSYFDGSLNNNSSIQRFELEQGVGRAVEHDEFVLHFQPKVRLEDSRVIGFEALIRWQHPHHNLLYPNDFIECIEESGNISKLGAWVVEAACRQQVKWRALGLKTVPVAVNVSPTEIKEKDYAENFLAMLEKYQLAASDIEIEITESAIFEDKQASHDNLERLAAAGVTISLDDFGNGFSSLSHIRSLPISTLKIDRSFINDMQKSRNDNAIVTSTIALAKKLKMTVVAEGIERHDQLIYLKLAGCDQVQGYFFSRPVDEEQARDFLRKPVRNVNDE